MRISHPNLIWLTVPALAGYGIFNASTDDSAAKKPNIPVATPGKLSSNEEFQRNVVEADWVVINKLKSNASWMEFLKSINISIEDLYCSKDKDPKESFITREVKFKNSNIANRIFSTYSSDKLLQQIPANELLQWWSIQNWISKNPKMAIEHFQKHAKSLGLGHLEYLADEENNSIWQEGIYSQILHPDLDTFTQLNTALGLACVHRRAAERLPIPKEESLIPLYDAADRELKNGRPKLIALHKK